MLVRYRGESDVETPRPSRCAPGVSEFRTHLVVVRVSRAVVLSSRSRPCVLVVHTPCAIVHHEHFPISLGDHCCRNPGRRHSGSSEPRLELSIVRSPVLPVVFFALIPPLCRCCFCRTLLKERPLLGRSCQSLWLTEIASACQWAALQSCGLFAYSLGDVRAVTLRKLYNTTGSSMRTADIAVGITRVADDEDPALQEWLPRQLIIDTILCEFSPLKARALEGVVTSSSHVLSVCVC
jgi:hypothetical protein